ncbi:MAG: tRNA (adenosine(37)-N6)-threonylcarbamoyltransferase complex dimerization subunit type 1 TsaB [Verrucomicrobia bacterium]|nr:tRNA (adenosine(37)-N6)-threonylcarbamoyltransferase complex dimerization subunit type 1 TsaB [Verrucomicrobiota bacterium]
MTKFLVIDTTSEASFVALFDDKALIQEISFSGKVASKRLLEIIKSINISDLTAICCGIGPGSFTGTRIGAMTAMTLSFAWQIPLLSYNSLVPYTPKGERALLKQGKALWLYEEPLHKVSQIISLQETLSPIYVMSSQIPALTEAFPNHTFLETTFCFERTFAFLKEQCEAKAFTDPRKLELLYNAP